MEELLNNISQEGLLVVCIAMSVVALLLAIFITAELFISRKKKKQLEFSSSNDNTPYMEDRELNIKYDENIKYEEENSEIERQKAKEELERIKNKLIQDEVRKSLYSEENNNNVEVTNNEYHDDTLEETKEYKVFDKSNVQDTSSNINTQIVNSNDYSNNTYEEIENTVEDINNNYEANYNDNIEVTNINEELEHKEEPSIEVEQIVEAPVVTEEKPKIDKDTKEKIIDDYLNQAILKRIHEEKEKQIKLKEEIENERKILLSEDNSNIGIINKEAEELPYIEDLKQITNDEDEDVYKARREYDVDSFINEFVKEDDEDKENIEIIDNKDIILESSKEEMPQVIEESKEIDQKPSVYEELEEENAIISYDELLKATKFGFTDEEMANYKDEEGAIISIDELETLYKEVNEIAKNDNRLDFSKIDFKTVDELPEISSEKKFKKSEIISPVFGEIKEKEEKKEDKEEEIEIISLSALSEEIKKTNDFLATLKDLQKNLE